MQIANPLSLDPAGGSNDVVAAAERLDADAHVELFQRLDRALALAHVYDDLDHRHPHDMLLERSSTDCPSSFQELERR
jgi:hypothetical protein